MDIQTYTIYGLVIFSGITLCFAWEVVKRIIRVEERMLGAENILIIKASEIGRLRSRITEIAKRKVKIKETETGWK